jgi:hypothetical protein
LLKYALTSAGTLLIETNPIRIKQIYITPKAKAGANTAIKIAPTSRKDTATKQTKPAAKPRKQEARDGSKKGAVIELLRHKEGVTAAEIAKRTKWQAHSIRGFISGTISKKMKLAVESVRNEQGERVYKVK